MSYTHIGVRTGYSLMDSTIDTNALVEEVVHKGMGAASISDRESVSALLAFYKACKGRGIKPLLGVELPIVFNEEAYPVILIAESEEGFGNIVELTSRHQLHQGLRLDDIHDLGKEVTALWRTRETPMAQPIVEGRKEEVLSVFRSFESVFSSLFAGVMATDFRQEQILHPHLKEWEKEEQMRCAAISDIRFLHEEDREAYEVLRAMDRGVKFQRGSSPVTVTSFYDPAMVEDFFRDWPEVIINNERIVSGNNVQLKLSRPLLPAYPVHGESSDQFLRRLCEDALKLKFQENRDEAMERLHHELEVISSRNFSDYFLIVWDFVAYAKKNGIKVGPGRGSAAGSIVAYLLDITTVDPLEHGLLFERFLNPERSSMPDIDIDFSDHRRDEVISYVREKYGREYVAQICTFGTFASRSTIREVGKALGVEEEDVTYILKHFPSSKPLGLTETVKQSENLKAFIRNSDVQKRLFRIGSKIEGLPRHMSTHAAGVVISECPLRRFTGLMNHEGPALLTQMTMHDVEALGLLKMDFLGLRNLSFLESVEKNIQKYKDSSFSLEIIPSNDAHTFEQLALGKTNGIFQLESGGMRKVLRQLRPERFEDIVAVNALYRPGPMEFIPDYIERKHGKASVTYPHEQVKEILKETYGVLVYQEQIMKIVQVVAGYSLGEADLFRRAVGKKQGDAIENEEDRFLRGASDRGYDEKVARQLFDWIIRFSNYGFNKSHAVAYSYISYWLAYIKAHYPEYFMAELMNGAVGDRDKLTGYVREAKRDGVLVKPPYINEAFPRAFVRSGSIILGFMLIKGIGYKVGQAIADERKNGYFSDFFDFSMRCSGFMDRNALESLIKAGSFDVHHGNRASLLASIDQALEQSELFKEFRGDKGFLDEWSGELVPKAPLPALKRLNLEKEALGTILSSHPLEEERKALERKNILTLSTMKERKGSVYIAAVIDKIREIRTKRGESMAFLTISDEKDEMDAVIFPEVYRTVSNWLEEDMIIIMQGKIQERNGEKQVQVQKIRPMQEVTEVFIKTTHQKYPHALGTLKEHAEHFPGNYDVYFYVEDEKKVYKVPEGHQISLGEGSEKRLKQEFGEKQVAIRNKWK
ncbi:DNA polymerase III subunit alpha [Salimicrobium halophilum]|uniref:DNA polymerase III subunit alpha n=1 Tax=Salimicrobium halophilum TaxID=86666 RepID=A0A1G8VHT7_9BACI|nr:DNA polymerase III subunit alpha [Salimicrobium halophilum]SDJ65661.1 DNA polymerase-3 subunit alpha [Salimicrobium halophilum]